jgi:hypothetical protein
MSLEIVATAGMMVPPVAVGLTVRVNANGVVLLPLTKGPPEYEHVRTFPLGAGQLHPVGTAVIVPKVVPAGIANFTVMPSVPVTGLSPSFDATAL